MSLLIKIKKRQSLDSKLAQARARVKVHWNEDDSPSGITQFSDWIDGLIEDIAPGTKGGTGNSDLEPFPTAAELPKPKVSHPVQKNGWPAKPKWWTVSCLSCSTICSWRR
jgi:hypothetical protein